VRALIPNPDRTLKPGVLMQVELLQNPRDSISVPESALLHQGHDHFVILMGDGDIAERRQVRIGARRPGDVEIIEGLVAGDRVVTHGNDKVRPGQKVTIQAIDDGSQSLKEMLEPGQ
jgi:membrane fusion protein (multidrug efflux system)